ncbi:MAG: histidine phosphatase family protein [Magnetococcales bacterium]|nr:histidine phosphatase family protein [Magnetococcales bacterium]
MSRQLLIMRHAKSAWDTGAPTDFERPLAARGQRDAPRMGRWLLSEDLVPDHVVSSPATRARETVTLVCETLGFKRKRIVWDARIYGADTDELLEVLAEVPKKAKTVLLVGHNPGLEFLSSFLANSVPQSDSVFESGLVRTATVVQLKMPEDWSTLQAGCASLITIQHPADLS